MSKREKAYERMINNPKTVRFDEITTLLKSVGFEHGNKTTHYTFRHKLLRDNITIVKRIPFVKRIYIENALEAYKEIKEKMEGNI